MNIKSESGQNRLLISQISVEALFVQYLAICAFTVGVAVFGACHPAVYYIEVFKCREWVHCA